MSKKTNDFFFSLINFIWIMLTFFIAYLFFSLIQLVCSDSLVLLILENLFFILIFYSIFKKVTKVYFLSIILGAYIISIFTIMGIIINKNKIKELPVEKSMFWTSERLNEFKYGTINIKIKLLKKSGLSKQEIQKKLKNNTEFRHLIKDGDKKFNKIYECPIVLSIQELHPCCYNQRIWIWS